MRQYLLTRKSAVALSAELHSIRQEHRSVDAFGKTVKELMVNFTLAQSENGNASEFAANNEKIALNAFANDLRDAEIKALVKARAYARLNDAINTARDEERLRRNANLDRQVIHAKTRGNPRCAQRGNGYRGGRGF